MLNHAFLIIAHDSPELLQRIVDKLAAPNHFFFVHLDKKVDRHLFAIVKNVKFIERINVTHGGFSQIVVEPMLLRAAIECGEHIDYFHLISGHDYPCRSNAEFDAFFEDNNGRSYMHYDTDEQHIKWKNKIEARYTKWNLRDLGLNRYLRYFITVVLNIFASKKVSFELYAGWNWFSWHRSVVEFIMKRLKDNPEYLELFRYTDCCDEVIFHTMLFKHLDELNIDKDNSLRYIDWFPEREYTTLPLVLDERDYDKIVESDAFFCRKVFIGSSSELLDKLDARIKCDETILLG